MTGVMCKFQIDFHLIWSSKAIHKVSFMDWFLTHLSKIDNKRSTRVVIYIENLTSWTKSYLYDTENVSYHNSKHKIITLSQRIHILSQPKWYTYSNSPSLGSSINTAQCECVKRWQYTLGNRSSLYLLLWRIFCWTKLTPHPGYATFSFGYFSKCCKQLIINS